MYIPHLTVLVCNPCNILSSLSSCLGVVCRIIAQLENLKKEAAEVQHKVDETDVVMAEVDTVSRQYLPLSTTFSSIYFTLESLNQVNILLYYSNYP